MRGVFSLLPIASQHEEIRFLIELDATEPYLDHHRPNGEPLLASVMGIEAMAEAARLVSGGNAAAAVSDVRILSPCILSAGGRHVIWVIVRRARENSQADFDCELVTPRDRGNALVHLQARIRLTHEVTALADGRNLRLSAIEEVSAVPKSTIYNLFFHGPCFQVVSSAHLLGGDMVCRLSTELAPTHRNSVGPTELAPQLMELGLQTAGLLELALSDRMMIPDRIQAVARATDCDAWDEDAIFAIAHRATTEDYTDVEIFNERGHVLMHISGYRTVPLPFAVDGVSLKQLSARLRASSISLMA